MSGRAGRIIFVGNLPSDVRKRKVADLFFKYGHIIKIDLRTPPLRLSYCFMEFKSSRDAEEAIKGRDGYYFDGYYLKVQPARRYGGAKIYGASHRSKYRVVVRGLPSSASWQDLKDHMRKAGDVCFAQVFESGDGAMGLVDYINYDDMKYAVRKLNGTEFRNPFAKSYIQVKISDGSTSRSANRSRNRSRSRSRSRRRRSRTRSMLRSA